MKEKRRSKRSRKKRKRSGRKSRRKIRDLNWVVSTIEEGLLKNVQLV